MASTAMTAARGVAQHVTSSADYQLGKSLGDRVIDRAVGEATPDVDAENRFTVVDEKGNVVEKTTRDAYAEEGLASASIMGVVRVIGGAMIGIAVLTVVLGEIFTLDQISNNTGPFSGVIDSLESTGVAALSLLVIGLLVAAANRVMGFFGGGGF